MRIVNGSVRLLIPLALTLALILGLNAQAARAAGTQHYAILAEAMAPLDSSIVYSHYQSAFLVTTTNSTLNSGTAYIAQVNLPDGAVISAVRVYGIDSDPTNNVGAALYRYNQDANPVWGNTPLASYATTSGSAGKFILNLAVDAGSATVDNSLYSYGVYITLPRASVYNASSPPLAVLRVVVDWGYSTFLPLAQK